MSSTAIIAGSAARSKRSHWALLVAYWLYLCFVGQLWLSPVDLLMLVPGYRASDPLGLTYVKYLGAVLSIGLIAVHGLQLLRNFRSFPEAVILPILLAASALWSLDAIGTATSVVSITVLMVTPIVFGHYMRQETLVLATWTFLVVVSMLSISLGVTGSDYGRMHSLGGVWRGVFSHKNSLGAAFGLTILTTIYAAPIRKRCPAALRWSIVFLCSIGLFAANSMAPLAAGLIAVAAVHSIDLVRSIRPRLLALPLVLLLLALLATCVVSLPGLLDLLGRNATLSGRTNSWAAVFPLIQSNFFGLGYGGSSATIVVDAISQRFGRAYAAIDNAYLILALELGWLAPVAYIAWLTRCASRRPRQPAVLGRHLVSILSLFLLAIAVSEKSGGPYLGLPFALFVIVNAAERLGTSSRAEPGEG